jgi:outer membrane protein TolC
MCSCSPPWRRAALRLASGLALLAAAWLGSSSSAEPPPPVVPAPQPPVVVPDVATARRIALERQPAVNAARASLAAALARKDSVDRLHVPVFLARDLPVRRQQSELGVTGAEAALCQAEVDARYDVTYTWLAVLYAREQQEVAVEVGKELRDQREVVKGLLDKKERRQLIKPEQLDHYDALLAILDARSEEAKQGEQRALAALREALGLGPDCVVVVPRRGLPDIRATLTRDEVVAAALARRGEMGQVAVALEATRLEIEAQRAVRLPSARTFASGSDLHAQSLPVPSRGFDYKPGAIGLEMPTTMNGPRSGRVEQAEALYDRAGAVAEKTRNLIALEAEDAFLAWQERRVAAEKLREAERKSRRYFEGLYSTFVGALDKDWYPSVESLLSGGSNYTRTRIDAREAHFQYLVLLARLERVTGGALCVDFDAPPPPADGGIKPAP